MDFELDYKEIIDEVQNSYYIYVVGGTYGMVRNPKYKIQEISSFLD